MSITPFIFWITTITLITITNGYFFIKALKIKPKSDSYLSSKDN